MIFSHPHGFASGPARLVPNLILAVIAATLAVSPAVAEERLPDGGVAKRAGKGVVEAYYARPTDRYGHAILGDGIEAGALVVIDDKGERHELVLPQKYVFEDITPRIADLDGDGQNEVITIRTDLEKGASVAVYDLENAQLVERAVTDPIGRTRRWLSIAAIDDFLGLGQKQIAIVKTPHIGGTLQLLALRKNQLKPLYAPYKGVSTHFIGSRDISLATTIDLNADGVPDLVVPDDARRRLYVLSFGHRIEKLTTMSLPSPLVRPLKVDDKGRILAPMENGKTMSFSAQ